MLKLTTTRTFRFNILIALAIGILVSFPEVMRTFENPRPQMNPPMEMHQDANAKHPMPPMDKQFPPNTQMHLPSIFKIFLDFSFFSILAIILLFLNNPLKTNIIIDIQAKRSLPFDKLFYSLLITIISFFIYSFLLNSLESRPINLNGLNFIKTFFSAIMSVAFANLILNQQQQQELTLQIEKLKAESIRNKFDALTSQISPHFLFNSFNSLDGLIRNKENKKALKYIKEISHIFRYILKVNQIELVTLQEEMHFVEAYRYLYQIRFEEKIHFQIDISTEHLESKTLPALSLQPLIENIVKHNEISDEYPMMVRMYIRNQNLLIVENKLQKFSTPQSSTGIGLANLNKRFLLLMNREITIYEHNDFFVVELPLKDVISNENN